MLLPPVKASVLVYSLPETTLASATAADYPATFLASQWTQMGGPRGGFVFDLFATSKKTLYVRSSIGFYRLTADATVWTPVNVSIPNGVFRVPMAEHADTLYMVSTDEVLVSTDNGETWNTLGSRPEGDSTELIVIDAAEGRNARASVTMYLALWDSGIFRSTDVGKHWTPREQWVNRSRGLQTRCY